MLRGLEELKSKLKSLGQFQAVTDCGGRNHCRDLLRTSIYVGIGLTIFWLEQALNLIFTVFLISLVVLLSWLSIFIAVSTSFVWLPLCLICIPLLTTVAILLRMTRLRDIFDGFFSKISMEPLKSKLWTKGILQLSQK